METDEDLMHYAAIYMAKYLDNVWTNVVPPYIFSTAPAVFWDLCDAGTRRQIGNTTYEMAANSTFSTTDTGFTFSTRGIQLGTRNAAATGGLVTVDTAITGYTDALGYAAAHNVFERCGKLLDCVERSKYSQIDRNDPSIFASWQEADKIVTTQDSTYGIKVAFGYLNGSSHQRLPFIHSGFHKARCLWLRRLCIASLQRTKNPQAYARHTITSTCSPQAILALRILKKWRGYEHHKKQVLIKPIRMSLYWVMFDSILKRIEEVGTITPFNTLAVTDVIHVINWCLYKHFAPWATLGLGHKISAIDASFVPTMSPGSYTVPSPQAGNTMLFRVINEALSRIYPYEDSDTVYAPVLWPNASTFTGTATYGAAVLSTYDYQTNIVAATAFGVANGKLNVETVVTAYQKALQQCGNYAPIGTALGTSRFNLASVTYVANSTAETIVVLSKDYFSEVSSQYLSITPCPEVYVETADSWKNHSSEVSHLFREYTRMSGIYMGTTGGQTGLLKGAIYATVHDKYGVGNPNAQVNGNEQESSYWDTGKRILQTVGGAVLTGTVSAAAANSGGNLLRRRLARAHANGLNEAEGRSNHFVTGEDLDEDSDGFYNIQNGEPAGNPPNRYAIYSRYRPQHQEL